MLLENSSVTIKISEFFFSFTSMANGTNLNLVWKIIKFYDNFSTNELHCIIIPIDRESQMSIEIIVIVKACFTLCWIKNNIDIYSFVHHFFSNEFIITEHCQKFEIHSLWIFKYLLYIIQDPICSLWILLCLWDRFLLMHKFNHHNFAL